MARNLINQVPCFLFTLKSLELRQDLIYSKLFRETRTSSTVGVFEEECCWYSKPFKQDPWTKSKQMKVLVEESVSFQNDVRRLWISSCRRDFTGLVTVCSVGSQAVVDNDQSPTTTSHAFEPRHRKIFEERAQQTLKSSSCSQKWKRQVKFTRGCKVHPI